MAQPLLMLQSMAWITSQSMISSTIYLAMVVLTTTKTIKSVVCIGRCVVCVLCSVWCVGLGRGDAWCVASREGFFQDCPPPQKDEGHGLTRSPSVCDIKSDA